MSGSGGGVIINADGSRLEVSPSTRTGTSLALPKVELPLLDDPNSGLSQRKLRAQVLLGASVLLAFGLVFWARRYRPGA